MTDFTTNVGIDHIQKQIDNCDTIVNNIDIIVPKLYKIRQQALAQKEYINDASRLLITLNDFTGTEGLQDTNRYTTKSVKFADGLTSTIKVFNGTAGGPALNENFVNTTTDAAKANKQLNAVQSLFKFKHDCGTDEHFTSDQIGVESDRTSGLNLADVVDLTIGLNKLLSHNSNQPTDISSDIKKLFLTPNNNTYTTITPDVAQGGFVANNVSTFSYNFNTSHSNGNGFLSLYDGITTDIKILGLGLTD